MLPGSQKADSSYSQMSLGIPISSFTVSVSRRFGTIVYTVTAGAASVCVMCQGNLSKNRVIISSTSTTSKHHTIEDMFDRNPYLNPLRGYLRLDLHTVYSSADLAGSDEI